MMAHTISTYHGIKMKGTEYLRGIYMASNLSIKPKTCLSKIDALKEIIRAWLQPRRNPDQRSPSTAPQNRNRPEPTGTGAIGPANNRVATADA